MPTIPTWPVLLTEWGAPYNANGGAPAAQNVDISNRVLESQSIKRGKQYELDSAQAGELTTTLRNTDAVLDQTNVAGPFAGRIQPYQPYRVRAQYPPTVNLLTNFQATGGEGFTTGLIPAGMGVISGTDTSGGQIVQSGTPVQGTNNFQFAVPAASAANTFICALQGVSAEPNKTYTLRMQVRDITASTAPSVKLAAGFYGPNFSVSPASTQFGTSTTLTGGTTWFTLTLTVTAPANACGMEVGVVVNSGPVTYNLQVDTAQLERSATASAFVAPGTWYPLFTGFVERWPSQWKDAGTFGTVTPTITDALALLSQGQLSDPLTQEINALNPRFLFRLDDPTDAVQAAEANGKFPPLNIVSGKYGTSPITFGNDIEATSPSGIFTAGGVDPTVLGITSPNPGDGAVNIPMSALSLDESGITGPATPLLWTRMVAYRWNGPASPVGNSGLWGSFGKTASGAGDSIQLGLQPSFGNQVTFGIGTPASNVGMAGAAPSGFNCYDGNWHLVFFGYNDSAQTLLCSVDGVTTGMTTPAGSGGWTPAIAKECLGGVITYSLQTADGFSGELAYAAEFPSLLTASQIQNLYAAWLNACSGDSSAARYSRILRYAKYTGPANIGAGCLTTDMGPATDLDGSDALTCLENVVVTENGTHFAARDGTITFQGRGFRYLNPTPAFTFGENVTAGEFPYEDLTLDFDTTHLTNDVTVTQTVTNQNFYAVSATDEVDFFDRTMTRSVNVNNPFEAQDAANFLVSRYGQPLTRVSLLTLNPSGQSALWPVVLQLELGMCIQVNRRPFGCPEISLLLWIEQIQWDISDNGTVSVQLQCSPALPQPQAEFAFWRTTLHTQAVAGNGSISVAAPAFDSVNPLGAQLIPGMQLVVHGTTNETMTIKSVSSTGSNWTTGTVTFTTALTSTHPIGSVVSEPPASAPNLSVFDKNAVFDSVVFTY